MKCPMIMILLAAFAASGMACATVAAAQQESAQAAGAKPRPCRADVRKLCHGVQPGAGRIVACLKENADKLSPACAGKLAKLRAKQPQQQDHEKKVEDELDGGE